MAILALGAAGCLTTTPPDVANWTLEAQNAMARAAEPKFGAVRLTGVIVDAPYDSREMPVLRANGSLAFDAYNRFAATPSQLLRAPVMELLSGTGLFKSVLPPSSISPAQLGVEVEVSRLALDCRDGETRTALVRLTLRFVDRTRGELACACGEGKSDAASGNYGAAFASAFASALETAVGEMTK